MDNELKEAIKICIELLALSVLLVIVAFFGNYARNALNTKNIQDETMTDIVEYRDIYQFTEGRQVGSDTFSNPLNTSSITEAVAKSYSTNELGKEHTVKGDDIVNFLGKHPFEYNVLIKTSDIGTHLLKKDSEKSEWEMGIMSSLLGEEVDSKFYCFAIYNSYTYEYEYIVFVEKTV